MEIEKIVQILKDANQPKSDFIKLMDTFEGNPFLVLISCILSLRTNDKTTYPATLRMLKLGNTPEEFAVCDVVNLEKAIFPVGFYKSKAQQIVELSQKLIDDYNSQVPADIEELVKFKGVGRKTANLVVARGFMKPAICVDVHVHRIFNRLGYVKTKTPDETEMVLRNQLPKEFWIEINNLLVTHGQNVCKPTKPMCGVCPINKYCQKIL